jgi:putative lipid kinase YegS-like protein
MIRRGEEWGTAVNAPVEGREVRTDADLAAALSAGGLLPLVRGGDVHRSLGAPSGRTPARRLPVDLLAVHADGRQLVAVAHVVARRRGALGWWRGPIVALMNVDHLGRWDVAPRAHPNDGWLDVLEVHPDMPARARWQASRRLTSGTHLPHPDVAVRRVREATFIFDRPLGLWVDGIEQEAVSVLRVRIVADAGEVLA